MSEAVFLPTISKYRSTLTSSGCSLAQIPRAAVEPEVVAHHLVEGTSGVRVVADDAKDLGLGVGDEVGHVDAREHQPMIGEGLRDPPVVSLVAVGRPRFDDRLG